MSPWDVRCVWPTHVVAVMHTLHGMDKLPGPNPIPILPVTPADADPLDVYMPALQDVIAQLQVMHDAWWRVNDALRLLKDMSSDDPTFMPDALADLEVLRRKIRHLQDGVYRQLNAWRQHIDGLAVQAMARSPEEAAALRARLAQADLNLSALYQHLLQLGKRCGEPMVQELSGQASGFPPPLWDAEVFVSLDYMLDDEHPLFDEMSNNTLAQQEPIDWRVTADGVRAHEMDDDPQIDNWLDYPHRWMDRQGWLTHDVLEHNDGHHPRFGVAALLHTSHVWVEVKTVRSYVYDLQAGRFVSPDAP
jgi:hypothetical protein